MKKPNRKFELMIHAGSDSYEGLVAELEFILIHMHEKMDSVSGGPSSNHVAYIRQYPEQTHEKYMDDLDVYLANAKDPK